MEDKKKKIILIADDERPMARALELKLESQGFETVTVFDGEEALKKFEAIEFDLLLVDLMMPKRDGFSVLSKIREKNQDIPIIVLSNLGQGEDIEKAKRAGATDYFVKSNTPISKIVKEINEAIK